MKKRIVTKLLLTFFLITVSFGMLTPRSSTNVSAADDLFQRYQLLHDQSDIDDRMKERDNAKAQAATAASKKNELMKQKNELSGELVNLRQLSDEQMAQYKIITEQLALALEEKAKALDEYIQAQENLTNQQELFSERVATMFEYQHKSVLEVLLEQDTIAGFFTNLEIITLIADSDSQAIDMMQIALDDAQLKSDMALKQAESLQQITDEKQAQLDELESRIGVTKEALDDITTSIPYYEQMEDNLNSLAANLDGQIADLRAQEEARKAQEAAAAAAAAAESSSGGSNSGGNSSGGSSSGGSSVPIPEYKRPKSNNSLRWPTKVHTVVSYFGYRIHPISGVPKFHSGIDIGAGYGDTVVAADDGVVTTVEEPCPGCNTGGTGYGNYCIVRHSNGISTRYAHMRSIEVSEGDEVEAGDCLGYVGSTGASTGAHLHFEVIKNGSTQDPLAYLP